MAARHQCEQTEHNYVAEAFNWESRVKTEDEASRTWVRNWGEIFAPNAPQTFNEKIQRLRQEIEKLPIQAMMSNSQISYTPVQPYESFGAADYKRKSWTHEED
jgi:hypothetical protein|mmetsp:Transcript_1428/g.3348  ORF Transcript_1428/g.3348 Transcript_1428/m.3348 type:complete len:103 (+) Transcript_1428:29-337(+)